MRWGDPDVLRLCWWQTFVCRPHWSDAGGEIAFADRVVCCLKLMVTNFCCSLTGLQGAECVLLGLHGTQKCRDVTPNAHSPSPNCGLDVAYPQPEGRERARALHHHTTQYYMFITCFERVSVKKLRNGGSVFYWHRNSSQPKIISLFFWTFLNIIAPVCQKLFEKLYHGYSHTRRSWLDYYIIWTRKLYTNI